MTVETTEKVVTVTPFRAADGHMLRLSAQAEASLRNVDVDRSFQEYERQGPGWTLRVNDQIVGCAGLLIPWPGVAHAWLLPSPDLPRYPRTVVQRVVVTLYDLIRQRHLRRVEADIQAGVDGFHRFAQALGFVPEFPCQCAGTGACPRTGWRRDHGHVKRAWGPNGEDYHPYVILEPRP